MAIQSFTSVIAAAAGGGGDPPTGADVLSAYKTASQLETGATPVDDDHLIVSLAANTWYNVEGLFLVDGDTSGVPRMEFEWTYSGTGSGHFFMYGCGEGGSSGITGTNTLNSVNTSGRVGATGWTGTVDIPNNNFDNNIDENGIVLTGAFRTTSAGNFTVQWGNTSTTAPYTRMWDRSYIMFWAVE